MNQIVDISIQAPPHTYHGLDSIRCLIPVLKNLRVDEPLYIISRGATAAGILDLLEPLWTEMDHERRVEPVVISAADISGSLASTLAQTCTEHGYDGIVAIGGGSILDLAKAVRLSLAFPGRALFELEGIRASESMEAPPLCLVPTTIGSGSAATHVAYLRNVVPDRPFKLNTAALRGEVAIIDPRLSKSASPAQTAMGVAATLGRAIESTLCVASNPVTEAYAMQAIRLIHEHAYRVVHTPHDLESRSAIGVASHLAGMATAHTGGTIAHTLSITLAQLTDIPYGLAMRILLPQTIRHEKSTGRARIGRLERLLTHVLRNDDSGESLSLELYLNEFLVGLTGNLTPPMPDRFYDATDPKGQTRLLDPWQLEGIAIAASASYDLLTAKAVPSIHELVRILEASYWGYELDIFDPWLHTTTEKRGTDGWNEQ